MIYILVGGLEHEWIMTFPSYCECHHPNWRTHIFSEGVGIPPTSIYIWVNYNELTTSSLEIIVSKGNHPQMALIQVSELL